MLQLISCFKIIFGLTIQLWVNKSSDKTLSVLILKLLINCLIKISIYLLESKWCLVKILTQFIITYSNNIWLNLCLLECDFYVDRIFCPESCVIFMWTEFSVLKVVWFFGKRLLKSNSKVTTTNQYWQIILNYHI